ncbi:conserved hypothetical protein [Ricinus communis]|uniref:Uncharacterized protein n=1 Tax=Ricinus communis TaxID=3988 RepID=B9SHM9_RICCO|nr:conserved hypothetical protein [Ricinus communis]
MEIAMISIAILAADVTRDDRFSKYREVVIEFYPKDLNGHPLQCLVLDCEVHLIYAQEESFNKWKAEVK